jgi:hypothetical protein
MADERAAGLLLALIANPDSATTLTLQEWRCVLGLARCEGLLGILAHALDLDSRSLPQRVHNILHEALCEAAYSHQLARWECVQLARDLADVDAQVVLLKGTAYAVAGLPCAPGRQAGDLDILVARARLGDVEAALQAKGWQSEAQTRYDAHYYRAWMHEIPPLKHQTRVMELDVHHTLLPLTGRIHPKPEVLLAHAQKIAGTRFYHLSLPDLIIHASVHVLQDGDLTKGLRTLVDVHRLVCAGAEMPGFWGDLVAHCAAHGCGKPVRDALQLCQKWLNTPLPADLMTSLAPARAKLWQPLWSWLANKRLQDPEGLSTRGWLARNYFYMRAHWRKMPPLLLARHLLIKALRRAAIQLT